MACLKFETSIIAALKNIDRQSIRAFVYAFILINLTFLFHTVNFMFGDHDWNFVRGASHWNEGSFEGRPLHFVLQALLFNGQVLPLLNSLFSFALLAAGGILLAKYWRIPQTVFNYAFFALFAAILPYTLVWLYYAKDTLINLSLPFFCVAALLIGDSPCKCWLKHFIVVGILLFALASYAAVINFIGVCLLGHVCLNYAEGKSFSAALREKIPVVLDAAAALLFYKVILSFSTLTGSYNTQIIGLDYLPQKVMQTLSAMLIQFVMPLPFMEYKYKILLMVFFVIGVLSVIVQGGKKRVAGVVLLLFGMMFSSKLAFFIADERGQILAEMENFAFVPRLDFYGLACLYAFALACILRLPEGKIRKACTIFAVVLAFMSAVRDMYAQKVWKLGFDAEMKAHERIVSRLEQLPEFDVHRQYRLLQIGSYSLRQNFYKQTSGEQVSLDLLETSFTPEFMSRIVYNFYYPKDVFYDNASAQELSNRGKEYLLRQAKPWPSADAIYIDGDIVIVVLTDDGLAKTQMQIR